jgi:hypothetical protein
LSKAWRFQFFLWRLPLLVVAAVLLLGVAAALVHAPAVAQERGGFGWSLRDLLFPRRRERIERIEPPVNVERPRPRKKKAVSRQPAEPPAPVVEKAPDARVVLVVGDFMASGLAEGLDAVFAENPGITVVDRSKGSSGFVRTDFYDWPAEIDGILKQEKPAAVLVMLGSNDRQQMKIGETSEMPRSENWTAQYKVRTKALGKAIAADKVPFLWVGQPAFRPGKMTSDMLAFNDIYRAAAEANGGEFLDIWDGFADEDGAYVGTGPDINGQPVRLRADDGINLTRAGKRKLAFYAEKPLLKILGLTAPDGNPAPSAPAGAPAIVNPDGTPAPAMVDRTPPMLLNDPALDGGAELLGAAPPVSATHPPGKNPAAEGMTVEGQPGRADDFIWPPRVQPAVTATGSGPETTTAISR